MFESDAMMEAPVVEMLALQISHAEVRVRKARDTMVEESKECERGERELISAHALAKLTDAQKKLHGLRMDYCKAKARALVGGAPSGPVEEAMGSLLKRLRDAEENDES